MFDNKISDSVVVLDKFKNNTVWTGASSGAYSEKLNELIGELNSELANIDKFEEVLLILDKIKKLDDDIQTLKNSLWAIPENATEETINSYSSHNASINSSIAEKTNERNDLREKAIKMLSEFGIIADIQIINIPNIEGATVLETYETGCIYEITISNNVSYQAFIPFEVDPTKPVIVYDPGDSGSGGINSVNNWNMFKDDFQNNGYDHIVIRSLRRDNSQYYNDLVNRLNLEPASKLFVSHSGGTTYNFYEYCDLIDEGDNSPGVIAVMDGYTPASWFENQGVTQKLIDSETIVFGFHQNWQNSYVKDYEGLAQDGVNMLILSDISEFGHSHGGVNQSLTQNGVLDFLTGNGELPDNYNIKYWDPNYVDENGKTGGFVVVNHDDVKTLDDVYNFFGIER